MSKKIYISVINDLSSDQRAHKVCTSLHEQGYEVHLVGRLLKDSVPINRPYATHRMKLVFTKGALFYAFYNIRLFLFLIFRNVDVVHANDLDTLLANYLISKLKGIPLIYDSHEYFTGVPEIQQRPAVKKVWITIEKWIFPRLKYVFTVNDSIADLYEKEYGLRPNVMRNIPMHTTLPQPIERNSITNDPSQKILVLQGAGINVDRGAEELLEAMVHLPNYLLMIIGSGDVITTLKLRAQRSDLQGKVLFLGKMSYEEMMRYTQIADGGLTLDKPTNINYLYSLPNKIFDYIKAGIPVLSSDLVELRKIIESYHVGTIIPNHDPLVIAETINTYLCNTDKDELKKHLTIAAGQLSWNNEVFMLLDTYKNLPNH
ncbi:MAG: glycosyltransferase [Flavobacteriales bacterium]|nr:glycosyltransferase [Flavobacteriales bacterium]MCB9198660.1 glycosyltransferase [Flavobacteriales bacterium]